MQKIKISKSKDILNESEYYRFKTTDQYSDICVDRSNECYFCNQKKVTFPIYSGYDAFVDICANCISQIRTQIELFEKRPPAPNPAPIEEFIETN